VQVEIIIKEWEDSRFSKCEKDYSRRHIFKPNPHNQTEEDGGGERRMEINNPLTEIPLSELLSLRRLLLTSKIESLVAL